MPGAQRDGIEAQAVHAESSLSQTLSGISRPAARNASPCSAPWITRSRRNCPARAYSFASKQPSSNRMRAGVQGADFRGLLQAGYGEAIGIVVQRGNSLRAHRGHRRSP